MTSDDLGTREGARCSCRSHGIPVSKARALETCLIDVILHEACWLVGDALETQFAKVDRTCLGIYLGELPASLLRFHGTDVSTRVRLITDVERLEGHPDCALPPGLVTSGFLTNSLKYAFGNGRGVIGARVERTKPEMACARLSDDGRGFPAVLSGGTGRKLMEPLRVSRRLFGLGQAAKACASV